MPDSPARWLHRLHNVLADKQDWRVNPFPFAHAMYRGSLYVHETLLDPVVEDPSNGIHLTKHNQSSRAVAEEVIISIHHAIKPQRAERCTTINMCL